MKRLIALLLVLFSISTIVSAQRRTRPRLRQPTAELSRLGPCHTDGVLPDSKCTPGAAYTKVTQRNIKRNICVSGFTKTIRPSTSYTDPLKRSLMAKYGVGGSLGDYELDHLISLQLGGDPIAVKNLWPEAYAGKDGENGARIKDRFEGYLKREVCARRMTLAEAQRQVATDWLGNWTAAGKP